MKKLRKPDATDILPRLEAIAQNLSVRNSEESLTYSNRELDARFENLSTLFREKHDDVMIKVGEIIVQTTRTNGKVQWTIKMIYLAMGGLGILSLVVLPLLFSLLQSGKL